MTTSGGDLAAPELPDALRARVLSAARAARPPGRAVPEAPPIAPVEAMRRTARALDDLLRSLSARQWTLPVLRDLDAQGLVGHLTGVEEDVQRALTGSEDVARVEHVASTDGAARRQAGRDPDETRVEWWAAVERTLTALARGGAQLADAVVGVHGLRLTVDQLLVVRAFELWTHENDIRRAAGLRPTAPDPSVLRLMTELAVRSLSRGVERAGLRPTGAAVRVVLTGPGGGTWDVALGPATADAPASSTASRTRVVADAVDFCRMVAGRVGRRDIAVDVAGDAKAAEDVLVAASSLALD